MRVLSVSISEKKGVKKHPVEYINLIEDYGIEGDAHAGKWHRQVSLLGVESMEAMKEKLPTLSEQISPYLCSQALSIQSRKSLSRSP